MLYKEVDESRKPKPTDVNVVSYRLRQSFRPSRGHRTCMCVPSVQGAALSDMRCLFLLSLQTAVLRIQRNTVVARTCFVKARWAASLVLVDEVPVETLHVRKHALPVGLLHDHHVLHVQERCDARLFTERRTR